MLIFLGFEKSCRHLITLSEIIALSCHKLISFIDIIALSFRAQVFRTRVFRAGVFRARVGDPLKRIQLIWLQYQKNQNQVNIVKQFFL